jgi:mRNA-degrading endonuclease RelE of RelBE toxin-antitoxin system
LQLFTVIETPLFSERWPAYWTADEFGAFCAFLASNPSEGVVVPGTGGVRKVRWGLAGAGKSGGVRVIYFVRSQAGELVLLTIYAKSQIETLKASTLKELRDAFDQ